jgi:uncharacterized protein YecA (UPF0149 family)
MTETKQLAAAADAILAQHGHEGHVHGPNCNHDHDHHGHHHHHAGETFVRTSPKVGRNDPCPCGSGKKHKKCCLA